MMFPFSIILGFAQGYQPVAGFNWGAKRYDRVRASYRFSAIVAVIGGVIMGLALCIFADWLIVLFAGGDEQMRRIGVICMATQALALPIHGWVCVVNMYCAGIGDAKGALALSTARQGTCFLPFVYPLAFAFGAYGVAVAQAVADVLSLALVLPILRSIGGQLTRAEAKMQGGNAT